MQHEFCMSCGHKAEFLVSKPNFCPGCGEPFNRSSASVSTSSRRATLQRQRQVEDDDFDEDDDQAIFDKAALREAWAAERLPGESLTIGTIGDLLNNPAPRGQRTYRPEAESGLSGEQLLKKIRQECGRTKASKSVG